MGKAIRGCILSLFFLQTLFVHGQEVISLQPAFSETQIILFDEIIGSWEIDLFGMDTLTFKKTGDNIYHLSIASADDNPLFEAVFTQIGEHLMLDITPFGYEKKIPDFRLDYLASCHTFFKTRIINDSLFLNSLNYSWFYENIVKPEKKLMTYTWSGTSMLLTAPTDSIRKMIETIGSDKEFFVEDLQLKKISGDESQKDFEIPELSNKAIHIQSCEPIFPIKDGWLGGDGDISVPFGPNKTLWLFSDSFVGKKEQTEREGTTMVANSIAIMECKEDGDVDMQYYWKNMYSDDPQPFFQSFTKRYRFWIADAFWVGNDLFVVLPKIGPKPEAHPDDIFNFSFLGFTLARIENPQDMTPENWTIQLHQWPILPVDKEWHWSVIEGNFLFYSLKDDTGNVFLHRLHLKNLLSPEKDTERENGHFLFQGDPGNSVTYYPELDQWIMVCGPGFLTSQIRLRTASGLTGPWSEEVLVYETPEQTPGTNLYDKDNFCYLGRDHFSFYDAQNQTLLITYDWNVANFHKLVNNLEIYIPKMIRVKIPE